MKAQKEGIVTKQSGPPPPNKATSTAFPAPGRLTSPPKIHQQPVKKNEEEEDKTEEKPADNNTPRFDLTGNLMTQNVETPESLDAGLHHHGDSPEKPGYAIYEIAILSRSCNASQRAFGFNILANILDVNPGKYEKEIREVQFPILIVDGFFNPSSDTIKSSIVRILESLLYKIPQPFALEPYAAIPPSTPFVSEFTPFAQKILINASFDPRILDILALLAPYTSPLDTRPIDHLPPSLPLLHLSRSLFLKHKVPFAINQARTSLLDSSIADEAALILGLNSEKIDLSILRSVRPSALSIFLSFCTETSLYAEFIPIILKEPPNSYSLKFLAKCLSHSSISSKELSPIIEEMHFGPYSVQILFSLSKKIYIPELPSSEKEYWLSRGNIAGVAEYAILTKDYSVLPRLLPCLLQFTDPYAERVMAEIFELPPTTERPLDPVDIFESLSTAPIEKVPKLIEISKYFPVQYIATVFLRQDVESLNDLLCKVVDSIPDPLPSKTLTIAEAGPFFERLTFDCFELECFQKFAYICISSGADMETRDAFWSNCTGFLANFKVGCTRRDVNEAPEKSREVIGSMVEAMRKNKFCDSLPLTIAFKKVVEFLKENKGKLSGEMVLSSVEELPSEWSQRIFQALEL